MKVITDYRYSIEDEHLKNEIIQIFLRISIVSIIILLLPSFDVVVLKINNNFSISILQFMLLVILCNVTYYIFIKKYPYLYQKERISFIAMMDIFSSVFIMSFVDQLSAYFPALLLWYVVGYGMRYDKVVTFIAYISVLLSWIYLITHSAYWMENINFATGWLVAYIIIPLYYFKLVAQLKSYIRELHHNVNDSNYQANHDALTELPNRLFFNQELDKYISTHKKFALFFIDLDGFKNINDKYGHDTGDRVLVEASKRMSKLNKFTARLSGDEFVCIVDYKDMKELYAIVNSCSSFIATECSNKNIELSASIGIACYPNDASHAYELKKRADEAMYRAKMNGKNRFFFYSDL